MASTVDNKTSMSKSNSIESDNTTFKKRKSTPPVQSHSTQTKRIKTEDQHARLSYSISPEYNANQHPNDEESPEEIAKQYKKFKNAAKFDLNSEELFCICRKPDRGELMVQCDGCEEWYHFKCMKLKQENSDLIAKFYCKFCKWQDKGNTLWKRKCRVSWCKKPIRNDSKYCSDDHGKLFMNELLVDRVSLVDNDLDATKVKKIMDHSDYNYEVLIKLGSEFPELKSVIDYRASNGANLDAFPIHIKQELHKIKQKLTKTTDLIRDLEKREEYLLDIKEKNKLLNERLLKAIFPDTKIEESSSSSSSKKKKQSKNKKLDICLYDKTLNDGCQSFIDEISSDDEKFNALKSIIEQKLNDSIDDVWYMDKLCIQDRRKCPRHNGWWNLLNDEVTKKLIECNQLLTKLEEQTESILRSHSIDVYES
ncbi:hypothetical protein DFJ63DRAFT_312491 [Scheffersomyces coipomensis]|uniref:uncharacterized protein n=1 Tax=Scheffersomyces coipomensis TaxID=1788519 RepID=UPI00315E02F2